MRPGLSEEEAAALFAIAPARLRALSKHGQLAPADGIWEPKQLKRLALRLIVQGRSEEQEAALHVFEMLRETAGDGE